MRILIASTAHGDPSFVRRFLAGEGIDVVAQTTTPDGLIEATSSTAPAAVVVDAEILADALPELRHASPATAVVVLRRPFVDARPPTGADVYLDRGTGLASLVDALRPLGPESERVPPRPDISDVAAPTQRVGDERPPGAAARLGEVWARPAASVTAPRLIRRTPRGPVAGSPFGEGDRAG